MEAAIPRLTSTFNSSTKSNKSKRNSRYNRRKSSLLKTARELISSLNSHPLLPNKLSHSWSRKRIETLKLASRLRKLLPVRRKRKYRKSASHRSLGCNREGFSMIWLKYNPLLNSMEVSKRSGRWRKISTTQWRRAMNLKRSSSGWSSTKSWKTSQLILAPARNSSLQRLKVKIAQLKVYALVKAQTFQELLSRWSLRMLLKSRQALPSMLTFRFSTTLWYPGKKEASLSSILSKSWPTVRLNQSSST